MTLNLKQAKYVIKQIFNHLYLIQILRGEETEMSKFSLGSHFAFSILFFGSY
jgi:hypothetical protein